MKDLGHLSCSPYQSGHNMHKGIYGQYHLHYPETYKCYLDIGTMTIESVPHPLVFSF